MHAGSFRLKSFEPAKPFFFTSVEILVSNYIKTTELRLVRLAEGFLYLMVMDRLPFPALESELAFFGTRPGCIYNAFEPVCCGDGLEGGVWSWAHNCVCDQTACWSRGCVVEQGGSEMRIVRWSLHSCSPNEFTSITARRARTCTWLIVHLSCAKGICR